MASTSEIKRQSENVGDQPTSKNQIRVAARSPKPTSPPSAA